MEARKCGVVAAASNGSEVAVWSSGFDLIKHVQSLPSLLHYFFILLCTNGINPSLLLDKFI